MNNTLTNLIELPQSCARHHHRGLGLGSNYKRIRIRNLLLVIFAVLALSTPSSANAQSGLEEMIFTAATTTTDDRGRQWAYIVWDATRPALLNGKSFAVYAKPGAPSTAGNYERKAVVSLQMDPVVIAPLLNRSVNLGENLLELTNAVNSLFQSLSNVTARPLPEKISLVIRGAASDPRVETNLRLLARLHPGVNLCLGTGYAELIGSGETTFELREINPATGAERGVSGRVTVTAGPPTILPAPSAPVQVPETSPKGDLNIRLRWATPPELRRVSLLSFGFNVWRMKKAFAEMRGYDARPPSIADLHSLVSSDRTNVSLVNRVPVLKGKDFDPGNGPGQVADFTSPGADTSTYFFADDNGRFDPGGEMFQDGEQFYYFVTARDLLSRDGLVSSGALARACRRMPPFAPDGLVVENDYYFDPVSGTNRQVFKLTWKQNTNPAPDLVTHYLIYRWPSIALIQTNQALPQNYFVAAVPHTPGLTVANYLDIGPGSPHMTNDAGHTFWYTIRAANSNACQGLLSPNSSPVFGVLRDRVGPDAPTGVIEVNCATPTIANPFTTAVTDPAPKPGEYHYIAACRRLDQGIAWVEFRETNSSQDLGRHYFPPGLDLLEVPYARPIPLFGGEPSLHLSWRVGSFDGKESSPMIVEITSHRPVGESRYDSVEAFLSNSAAPSGHGHPPPPPGQTGARATIQRGAEGRIVITVPGISGTCLVQASTDLVRWVDVTEVTVVGDMLGNGLLIFNDPLSRTLPYRFYRALPVNSATSSDCTHLARVPGSSEVHRIRIRISLPPTTASYQIYRRVNDGPLTLIAQGIGKFIPPATTITRSDDAMPPNGSTICYYAQVFDRNGNASPLALIGAKCVQVTGALPTPLLSPPEAVGTSTSPQMKLRWYCPPSGVDRFKITVCEGNSGSGNSSIHSQKLIRVANHVPATFYATTPSSFLATKSVLVAFQGVPAAKVCAADAFLTGRVGGPDLGPGPNFELVVNVEPNVEYKVRLHAVNGSNTSSESSTHLFTWELRPPGPNVPWPARPLPSAQYQGLFHPRIEAKLLTNFNTGRWQSDYPVGVRIAELGTYDVTVSLTSTGFLWSPNLSDFPREPIDPNFYLYRTKFPDSSSPYYLEPIFPVVLYRFQVTNANFPRVSGDVVQVSPLMEKIAWQRISLGGQPAMVLRDSFLDVVRDRAPRGLPPCLDCPVQYDDFFGVYLRDTQPVVRGARYRYFLVRFDTNKEIEQVVNAGEVEIPE